MVGRDIKLMHPLSPLFKTIENVYLYYNLLQNSIVLIGLLLVTHFMKINALIGLNAKLQAAVQ